MNRRRALAQLPLGGAALLATLAGAKPAAAQAPAQTPYTEVFYGSGGLNIQAYYYRPAGSGPFPLVIYNHGSRPNGERTSLPFLYIGALFTRAGYAVLVPERRGYGKSDGQTHAEEFGRDVGPSLVARLNEETEDVLAAFDFAATLPGVDRQRSAIVGWSLGGIITMFTVARSAAFRCAIAQAGGALTWDRSPAVRAALTAAARGAQAPTLMMIAANDRTTAAVTTLDAAMTAAGRPHDVHIYPPFTPPRNTVAGMPPGHLIFGAAGASIWGDDAVAYLRQYLG
jgi:dienelactone hydrolase